MIQLGGYIFEIPIFGNFLSGVAKKEQMQLDKQQKGNRYSWVSSNKLGG